MGACYSLLFPKDPLTVATEKELDKAIADYQYFHDLMHNESEPTWQEGP
jgi:hypothetical protein